MHCIQNDGENFGEFLRTLKELHESCDICNCKYNTLLKDQISNGLPDARLRERLTGYYASVD